MHERQRAAEVEEAVRAAERVGDHRAGEDDRLARARRQRGGQRPRRLHHRVRAVRDDDAASRRASGTASTMQRAVGVGHVEAVDHHQRLGSTPRRRQRPSRSISGRCVSLKNSEPVSSLYSLSNVPPVTKIRIRLSDSYWFVALNRPFWAAAR